MDTISKQYEQDPHDEQDQRHEHDRQHEHHNTSDNLHQDGYEGGGAPWES
ncbi:hypothetical protein ACFYPC_20450 [Streptomyces sp. NPDC005808]